MKLANPETHNKMTVKIDKYRSSRKLRRGAGNEWRHQMTAWCQDSRVWRRWFDRSEPRNEPRFEASPSAGRMTRRSIFSSDQASSGRRNDSAAFCNSDTPGLARRTTRHIEKVSLSYCAEEGLRVPLLLVRAQPAKQSAAVSEQKTSLSFENPPTRRPRQTAVESPTDRPDWPGQSRQYAHVWPVEFR